MEEEIFLTSLSSSSSIMAVTWLDKPMRRHPEREPEPAVCRACLPGAQRGAEVGGQAMWEGFLENNDYQIFVNSISMF